MLKLVIPIIIVLTLIGGGFYLYKNLQTKQVNQTSPPTQAISTPSRSTESPTASPLTKSGPCEVLTKGNTEIPPLYKEGVTWQEPKITMRELSEFENPSTGEGFSSAQKNGCLIQSTTTIDSANKIRDFYMENLSKDGWKLVDAADGPSGSLVTYKKDKRYFNFNRLNDQLELFYAY